MYCLPPDSSLCAVGCSVWPDATLWLPVAPVPVPVSSLYRYYYHSSTGCKGIPVPEAAAGGQLLPGYSPGSMLGMLWVCGAPHGCCWLVCLPSNVVAGAPACVCLPKGACTRLLRLCRVYRPAGKAVGSSPKGLLPSSVAGAGEGLRPCLKWSCTGWWFNPLTPAQAYNKIICAHMGGTALLAGCRCFFTVAMALGAPQIYGEGLVCCGNRVFAKLIPLCVTGPSLACVCGTLHPASVDDSQQRPCLAAALLALLCHRSVGCASWDHMRAGQCLLSEGLKLQPCEQPGCCCCGYTSMVAHLATALVSMLGLV